MIRLIFYLVDDKMHAAPLNVLQNIVADVCSFLLSQKPKDSQEIDEEL